VGEWSMGGLEHREFTMRFVINALCASCFLALVVALFITAKNAAVEALAVDGAATSVRRIEQIIRLRASMKDTVLNERGYPVMVSPGWFKDEDGKGTVPVNPLMGEGQPWLEIAGEHDAGLEHPPVRLAVSESLAQFWYNPYQGIVRARIPVMVSDVKSTDLYNRVNGTALAGILDYERSRKDVFKQVEKPGAAPIFEHARVTEDPAKPAD